MLKALQMITVTKTYGTRTTPLGKYTWSHRYMIFENLAAINELGYFDPDLDEN
jgi:gentisate 1,2-dioxygenase